MEAIIKFAEDALACAEKNGCDRDMRYWAAYLDGARAVLKKAREIEV